MKTGAWHQCGDRSQKMVVEELQTGKGVGVVLSPRDLDYKGATKYASEYRSLGADVAIDPQFHTPSFSNPHLSSYPTHAFRMSIANLVGIGEQQLSAFAKKLEEENSKLGATVLIAPAVLYEAGRADVDDLNRRLFRVSKAVGDSLGVPTLATVFLARSVTQSDAATNAALSSATSGNCDGWYFGFEFPDAERLPSNKDSVVRFCRSTLALACTGLPVLHAFAGPMALLSIASGARAAGVGHFKNLWRFDRDRWSPPKQKQKGGPKKPPPRFFSKALWGTIVYPDEVRQLGTSLQTRVLQPSPFSMPVGQGLDWDRWSASKHLVSVVCDEVAAVAALVQPVAAVSHAKRVLQQAVRNHAAIAATGLRLRDDADAYQAVWLAALRDVEKACAQDLNYLELLRQ